MADERKISTEVEKKDIGDASVTVDKDLKMNENRNEGVALGTNESVASEKEKMNAEANGSLVLNVDENSSASVESVDNAAGKDYDSEQAYIDAAREVDAFDKKRLANPDEEDMMLLSVDENGEARVDELRRDALNSSDSDEDGLSPEEKAAREVNRFLENNEEDPDYDSGDQLVISVEEEENNGSADPEEDDDSVLFTDAMREELLLLRQQREELEELCDRHRRLLDANEADASDSDKQNVEQALEETEEEELEAEETEEVSAESEETDDTIAVSASEAQTEDEQTENAAEELEPIFIDNDSVRGVKNMGAEVADANGLKDYLRRSDKIRKKLVKEVEKAELDFDKNEDENDSPALIAEILMKLAPVLELLSDNVSVCYRAGHKKNTKKYSGILSEYIDTYNKNVIAFYDLTGQQLTRVSAFLPQELQSEDKVGIIPALSYRETFIEIYVEKDGTVPGIDDSVTTTVIAPPYTRSELLGDVDVDDAAAANAYRKKANAAIEKLSAEKEKINSKIKNNSQKSEKCKAAEKKAKERLARAIAELNGGFNEKARESKLYKRRLEAINKNYGKAILKAEADIAKNDYDRKNLKLLVETVAIEREKLDCLCTLLRKIRIISPDKVVDGIKKSFVRQMLEYNKLSEACSAATGTPIAKLSASLADEVVRTGSEVLFPRMAYRRELVETVGEETRIVGDRLKTAFVGDIGGDESYSDIGTTEGIDKNHYYGEKLFEFEQTAVNITREAAEGIATRKGLGQFMKRTARTDKMFRRTLKQIDKSIMRAIDDSNVVSMLIENLRVSGRYIEFLAIRLVTSAKFLGSQKIGNQTDALYKQISRYNQRANDYSSLTGEQVTRISAFLPERLAERTAEILLPSLSYKETYAEVYPKKSESKFESFEDVIDRRLSDSYVPILFKNRKLSENKAVTVTPINPPFSAEDMSVQSGVSSVKAKISNSIAVRRAERKLRRRLKRINRIIKRLDRKNKRFDKKFASLTKKHEAGLFRIESVTSEHERQSAAYKKKLQKVNNKFTSKSLKLKFKKARAAIERRKTRLYAERFVIEREYLAIGCRSLANMRSYGRPSVVAEAKNNLIKIMAEYNKCADLCSSLIGEPIAKISSSIADEIIRDGKKEVKLPMVVCYRETVETVGDKVRTIGDRFRLVTGQLNRNGVSYDAYGNPTLGSEITGMHAIPMMAPIYGFMPDALSAQTTSLLGDAYDESYVNKAIVSLSKYDIPALKAKSFVVENRRDYRRYKRISRELVGEIKKLFKKTDKEHRKVESVIANIKRDANGREKKAYGAIIKRLSRYLGGCSDRFVASKIAHIISVVEEYMASKRPVVEAQEYANDVLLRDIAPKFDLDNVCSASKLVEIRSCDLYASTKINAGRYFRRDQDALSVEIERYNDYVIEFATESGERLTHVSVLVPDKIVAKEGMPIIPELYYSEKFVEERESVKADIGAAYTLYIPSPAELAQGATIATVINPDLNKIRNDRTVREIVEVPHEYTADELLKGTEQVSAKKYFKISDKANSRIDRRIEIDEAAIDKQSKALRNRKKAIEKATRRYEKRMLRASCRAHNPVRYHKRLRRISMDYGKSIFKIDRRYPAPELLESKRLLLECFALEQTKFEIVSRMLQRVSKSRNRKLLRKAKRAFISAVIHYNEVADKVSASLRTSVTHIDEGYIDYVLVDDIIPTLKRVVYEKDVVEVVGDKRRVIGERAAQPTSAYNIVFGAGVFNGGVGASVSTSAAEATSANSVASVEEPASAVAPEAFATSPVITAVPVSVPTRAVANVPVYVYNEGNGNELPCAPIKEVDEDGDVQPIRYSEARGDERSERTVPVNGVSYEQDPAFTQGGQNSSFNVPAHHTQYAQVPGTNDYVLTPTSNGRLTSDNKGGNYVASAPTYANFDADAIDPSVLKNAQPVYYAAPAIVGNGRRTAIPMFNGAVENQSAPMYVQAAPMYAQAAPANAKSAPMYVQPAPMYAQATPVDAKSAPMYVQAAPMYAQAAPANAKSAPMYVQAAPMYAQAAPANAKSAPMYVQAAPMYAQAAPANAKSAPMYVQPAPMYAQATPANAKSAPMYTQAAPMYAQATPVNAKSVPMYVQPAPMYAQAAPANAKSAPMYIQPAPMYAQAAPANAKSAPMYVQPAPMYAQAAPANAKSAPMYFQPAPMYAQAALANAKSAPMYVQPAPMYAQAAPVDAKSAPMYIQPAPMYAQAAPVNAKSAPMYVQAAPMYAQAAPANAKSAPMYVQAAPMYAQATPANAKSAPMYVQAAPMYAQPASEKRAPVYQTMVVPAYAEEPAGYNAMPEMIFDMAEQYPEAPMVRNPAILNLHKRERAYYGIPKNAATVTVPMSAVAPGADASYGSFTVPMQAYYPDFEDRDEPPFMAMPVTRVDKKAKKKDLGPYFTVMPMYSGAPGKKGAMDMAVPMASMMPVSSPRVPVSEAGENELLSNSLAFLAMMSYPDYDQPIKAARGYAPHSEPLYLVPDMKRVDSYNTLANGKRTPKVISVGAPRVNWDQSMVNDINRTELSSYINETKKKVNKADKKVGKLLSSLPKVSVEDRPAVLVEALGYCKDIIDEVSDNMVAAVSINEIGVAKKLSDVLKNQIRRYNAISREFSIITKQPLPLASTSMPKSILSGKSYQTLPRLEYVAASSKVMPVSTEEDAEYKLTLNAAAKRNDGMIGDLALQEKVAEQANKDLSIITKYCDFEISMLESARDIERFRFGGDKKVIKSNSKSIAKHIEKIKKTHREAIEYEARDNERYYTVVLADPYTIPTKRKNPNRAKMDSIRNRLIVLLNRRDEINSALSAIYTGTEKASDGSSINQKWRHIKNCAAEEMAKKDRALAKKVSRVSASKSEKHRMFTLLNKRLDAASTLELCKFRLKYEKNTYRVRHTLKSDIKNCKTVLRRCKKDIHWMIKRFKKRDAEAGGSWITALGFILLLVIGLAAGYVWLFRQDIGQILSMLFGG